MTDSVFLNQYRNRVERLAQYKKEAGTPIFAYFCTLIPEEIIHAAGILPIRMLGNGESSEKADAYLQSYVCSFSRNCLATLLNDDYGFLDGLVMGHSCDTMSGLFGIINRNIPLGFTKFLKLPVTFSKPQTKALLTEEFKSLMSQLEGYVGRKITDTDLERSIDVYNTNRALLQQLSELRAGKAPKLKGSEVLEVSLAGFTMDKRVHNTLMQELVEEVTDREPVPAGKARLLVAGNVVDDVSLVQAIEALGADVVSDDLCTGSRYAGEPVSQNSGDPLAAIVDSFIARTFCPCKTGWERRTTKLLSLYEQSQAQGIILLQQKFCDPHLWDYANIKAECAKRGIPLQMVEFEQPIRSIGTITNRVESFIEVIGG